MTRAICFFADHWLGLIVAGAAVWAAGVVGGLVIDGWAGDEDDLDSPWTEALLRGASDIPIERRTA